MKGGGVTVVGVPRHDNMFTGSVLHFMECLIDVREVFLLRGVMTQCRDSGHKTLTRGWSPRVFTDGNIIHTTGIEIGPVSIDIKVP